MPPLARRSYRFGAQMRREYPASKAFLASQRDGVPTRTAESVVPRRTLPRREGPTRHGQAHADTGQRRSTARAMRAVLNLFRGGDR